MGGDLLDACVVGGPRLHEEVISLAVGWVLCIGVIQQFLNPDEDLYIAHIYIYIYIVSPKEMYCIYV